MHAKVFSIQIFQYFCQIPPRVCTLVLFIYLLQVKQDPSEIYVISTSLDLINPRCACAVRVRSCLVCVCVCVCACVCACVHACVRACVRVCIGFLPPLASRLQYIGTCTFGFTATEKTFIILIFTINILFRSYSIICFLECHQLHLSPKIRISTDLRNVAMTFLFATLTKNGSFRNYGTFAYLL